MAAPNSTKKPLTAIRINALKPNQTLVDTGANAGLRVICGKKGVKTFFYRFRSPIDNKLKQLSLGFLVVPKDEDLRPALGKKLLTLNSARGILSQLKLQRKSGICPATQAKEDAARAAQANQSKFTISELVEAYLSKKVEDHPRIDTKGILTREIIKGSRSTTKGQKETRRTLENVTKTQFGDRIAQDVTHIDIQNLINGLLAAGTPVQAGRVLNELKLAYNFCIGTPDPKVGVIAENWKHYLPHDTVNPCIQALTFFSDKKIKLSAGKKTRNLNDAEIVTLLKWLPTSKFTPICKHTLWLTLYTGLRSGEVMTARKSDFNLEKGTWFIPQGKGVERTVQLSYQAVNYLKPLIDNPVNVTPFLLPSQRTGLPQQQKQLSEQAWLVKSKGGMPDIPHWTAHDLRRSCRTGLSKLGCPSEVGEAVLGHTKGGIEGVYNLYEYETECKVWLQKWADHIDVLMGKVSNVISISREA